MFLEGLGIRCRAAGKSQSEVPWPDMQHACYFAGSLQMQSYVIQGNSYSSIWTLC